MVTSTVKDSVVHQENGPSPIVREIAVGDVTDIEAPSRGIWCSEAGTISYRDHSATLVEDFPVKQYDNPIGVKRITAVSGSMTVWALY